MKKHFLFVAIAIAALTSLFAQKVEQRPASQAAAAALMEANNPKIVRISPGENAYIYIRIINKIKFQPIAGVLGVAATCN